MYIHLSNVCLWRKRAFLFICCLFTTARVLFQVAQKADKVTAAGQTVQDVDSQHSETDSRRDIKKSGISIEIKLLFQTRAERAGSWQRSYFHAAGVCLLGKTDRWLNSMGART